jgi:hypothetical protein
MPYNRQNRAYDILNHTVIFGKILEIIGNNGRKNAIFRDKYRLNQP